MEGLGNGSSWHKCCSRLLGIEQRFHALAKRKIRTAPAFGLDYTTATIRSMAQTIELRRVWDRFDAAVAYGGAPTHGRIKK